MGRGLITCIVAIQSAYLWAAPLPETQIDGDLYYGQIRIVSLPLRFAGPTLEISEATQEVELIPIDGGGKTESSASLFKVTLQGRAKKAVSMTLDGQPIKLESDGSWSFVKSIVPGNNKCIIFLKNSEGATSSYELDVQLLTYRRDFEDYYDEPPPYRSVVPRETGWALGLSGTTGTYDLKYVRTAGNPGVLSSLKDNIINVDLTAEATVQYWFDDEHPIFRDVGMQAWLFYLLPIGNNPPDLFQSRIGMLWRYFFVEERLSPMMTVGFGGMNYYFSHTSDVTLTPNYVFDYGFYGEIKGKLPISSRLAFVGGGMYGIYFPSVTPRSGSTHAFQFEGGASFGILSALSLDLKIAYRDYRVVERNTREGLTQKFVSLLTEIHLDL